MNVRNPSETLQDLDAISLDEDQNYFKSCGRSDKKSHSKTHQDLNVILTPSQGEASKLTKGSNNTSKTDARDHLLGQKLQRQAK